MDVVYNHLGPSGNYLAEFGPYFTDRHHTDWGPAINFDGAESHELRRLVIDNALMWLRDYHCDGLRIDAVHAIADESPIHILEELGSEVGALAGHLRRPLFLIAESDLNEPRLVHGRDSGGYGLDAAWADEWHHALHARLTGEKDGHYSDFGSLSTLAKALRQAWVHDGQWSEYRRRTRGRPPTGLDGSRFVVSLQNHDQIGNRAQGERLGHLISAARIKVAAALLLTGPFTPLLFQGEEWGGTSPFQYFADMDDPDLARAVRDGRRREFSGFGWNIEHLPDPGDPATFERSKVDWSELHEARHAEILNWYRQLIRLRHDLPALSDPRPERHRVWWDESTGWVIAQRGQYLVVASLACDTVVLPVPPDSAAVAMSDQATHLGDGRLVLPPDSAAILRTTHL
jgi:maltooligosyltrehalose trehalohydrolase